MSAQVSDSVLVQQAFSNIHKYEALIEKYYAQVYKFCVKQVSNPIEAEDITQEVFASAHASLHMLREPAKLHPWLLGIAFNLSKRWLRHKYQYHIKPSTDELDDTYMYKHHISSLSSSPEDKVLQQLEFSPLYDIMQSMPSKARESLEMYCLDDMSYRDIADLLGVPVSTVRGRIYNAKQWLLSNTLAPETPRNVREQIAEMVTSAAKDYDHLRLALSTEALKNQIILALLNSVRIVRARLKAYTYRNKLDSLMVTTNMDELHIAVIDTAKKAAVAAFMQLLNKGKRTHVIVTNPKVWPMVESLATVENVRHYLTYYLIPQNYKPSTPGLEVSEVSLPNSSVRDYLCSRDSKLANLIHCMENEDPDYLAGLRLIISTDSDRRNTSAYVLFADSGVASLWELARHNAFIDDGTKHIEACISFGSQLLLNEGRCITVNGVAPDNILLRRILERIGYVLSSSQVSAYVTVQ
jgi:RNA polymerase sigma-70 factor (ECF subfamily)